MGKIIDFTDEHQSRVNEGRENTPMEKDKPSKTETILSFDSERTSLKREERDEHWRRHCARVLERVNANPKLNDDDRLQIARNLYTLVAAAKSDNLNLINVLKAARQFNEGESTKRLYFYTIDPNLKGTEEEINRITRLRRKASGYVRIAQGIAGERGLADKNAHLSDLFRGTSYSDQAEFPEDAFAETYASAFQQLLLEMIEALSIDHDLTNYFEKVQRFRVPAFQLDPEKYWIEHWNCQVVLDKTTDWDFAYAGETGGLPSVQLYRLNLGAVPARMKVSQDSIGRSNEVFPEIPLDASFGPWVNAKLQVWQEVRLAICPVAGASLPKPFFELRYAPLLETPDQVFDLRSMYINFEGGYFPVIDGELQYLGLVETEAELPRRYDNPFDVESYYTWFYRANPANSKRLLERRIDLPQLEIFPWLPGKLSGDVGFPSDTIGAAVEERLYDGTLEQEFEGIITARHQLLDVFLETRDKILAERRAAARARWRRSR